MEEPVAVSARRSVRSAVAVATALALAVVAGACSTDDIDPSSAVDRDRLDDLGEQLSSGYESVRDQIGDGSDHLLAASSCLAEAARETWGDATLQQYGVGGGDVDVDRLLEELDGDTDRLDGVVSGCVEVDDTLVSAFEGIGLSEESATCVADVVLNDRQLRNGLLVQLVFGDPGVGTALVAAARVGRACLDPDELDRLGI